MAAHRPLPFLLQFDPGTSYPYHPHPAGEQIFVLEEEVTIAGETRFSGDYLYTPPSVNHSLFSEKKCVLFLNVPRKVEILEHNK